MILIPKRLLLVTGITLSQVACSRETDQSAPPPDQPRIPVTSISITAETPAPPPMEFTRTTTTTTEGGSEEIRDVALGTGGRMAGSGDAAKLDNGVFTVPAATLEAIGNAVGGGVSGSLTAKVGGTWIIRIIALLASIGLGALAFLNFKKSPLDWHYTGGLALGSLAAFAVFIEPELLYLGIAGVAVAALINFWPSIAAKRFERTSDEYQAFIDDDPQRIADWAAWKKTLPDRTLRADLKTIRRDAI